MRETKKYAPWEWVLAVVSLGVLAVIIISMNMPRAIDDSAVDAIIERAAKGRPSDTRTPSARCVARGIAYFKEIGSFPHLSDGRDSATVAIERCSRTSTAFGID
jgi:hypothetical protein